MGSLSRLGSPSNFSPFKVSFDARTVEWLCRKRRQAAVIVCQPKCSQDQTQQSLPAQSEALKHQKELCWGILCFLIHQNESHIHLKGQEDPYIKSTSSGPYVPHARSSSEKRHYCPVRSPWLVRVLESCCGTRTWRLGAPARLPALMEHVVDFVVK